MQEHNWYVDPYRKIEDILETQFPYGNILHVQGFLLFAGVSVQINAVSSTLIVTDHKHVLLVNVIFLVPCF